MFTIKPRPFVGRDGDNAGCGIWIPPVIGVRHATADDQARVRTRVQDLKKQLFCDVYPGFPQGKVGRGYRFPPFAVPLTTGPEKILASGLNVGTGPVPITPVMVAEDNQSLNPE